jgi:UDP-N-acetylglucosamine 2-epimerase
MDTDNCLDIINPMEKKIKTGLNGILNAFESIGEEKKDLNFIYNCSPEHFEKRLEKINDENIKNKMDIVKIEEINIEEELGF